MKTKSHNCKRKGKLFIFDLDHTLIRGNCSFYFGVHLFKHKVLSFSRMITLFSFYLFFKIGLIGMRKLHEFIFSHFFCGLSVNIVDFHASQFISQKFRELINQSAFSKLQEAQEQGCYTAILSSSPDFLVEKIASFLSVDKWDSTIYQKDKLNHFSHISQLMEGRQKAQALLKLMEDLKLCKEDVTAYTDSYLDLPFLQVAGNPIAVNPDRRLKALCRRYHWPII